MNNVNNICENLKNGKFELFYTPQYSLGTLELVGAEACICYSNSQEKPHAAGTFISWSEEPDQIPQLDLWAFRQVCIRQHQWLSKHFTLIPITVNISIQTLCNPYCIFDIAMFLHEFDLPPRAIKLGINASTPCANFYEMEKGITHLKSQGLEFVLTHLGAGFSTLSLFSTVAFEQIILDKQFVTNMFTSTRMFAILKTIIGLYRELNMEVIADGVSSIVEAEELKKLGCSMAQGSFYSPPLTEAEFEKYCTDL